MRRAQTPFQRGGTAAILRLFRLKFLWLALLCIPCLPLSASADRNDGTPPTLRVGISSQVFPDLDHNDVRIAMSLWTREVARRVGVECQPQPVIFNTSTDLLNAVKKGELTLASLSALEYLQIHDRAPMTPLIVSSRNNGKGQRFVLITHCSSGIRTVKELNGKTIIIPPTKNRASHLWLDVLLLGEGKRERNAFFRQVREGEKASQAITNIFFRQADAAVVSRDALETSKTLNPQIGSKVSVIAESDYLLDGVTCVPHQVGAKLRADIENAALHLHENTAGKQILTLFQMERTTLFHPSQLAGVEGLLRERDRLLARLTKKRQNR
jgi:phosphonate transport system substrate-binding protein